MILKFEGTVLKSYGWIDHAQETRAPFVALITVNSCWSVHPISRRQKMATTKPVSKVKNSSPDPI